MKRLGYLLLLFLSSNLHAQDLSDPAAILQMVEIEDTAHTQGAIDQYLQDHPKDPQAYYLQGYLFQHLKAYQAAVSAFEKGIQHDKRFAYNHIGAAVAYHHLKKETLRDKHLALALKYAGQQGEPMLALADAYQDMGMHSKATVLYYQLHEMAPDDGKVLDHLGQSRYENGQIEMAIKAFGQADSLGGISLGNKYHLAEFHLKNARYKLAEKHYRELLARSPDFAPAYKGIGELWLRAKNYPKAREQYERYMDMVADDQKAQLRLASVCYLTGDYAACFEYMKSVQTSSLVKQRLTAYCQLELGQLTAAEEGMKAFFQTAPATRILAEDHEVMGRIFLKKDQDSLAVRHFEKMHSLDKSNTFTDYYLTLARNFNESKAYKREAFFRKKALEQLSDPTAKDLYFYAAAARKSDQLAESIAAYEAAIKKDSAFAVAHFWLGFVMQESIEENPPFEGKKHYQATWDLLAGEADSTLSQMESYCVRNSGLYLVFDEWAEKKAEGCHTILPYIHRLFALDPTLQETEEGDDLRKLQAYCEE